MPIDIDTSHLRHLIDIIRAVKAAPAHIIVVSGQRGIDIRRFSEMLASTGPVVKNLVVIGVADIPLRPVPEPKKIKLPAMLVDSRQKIRLSPNRPDNSKNYLNFPESRQKSSVRNFFRRRGNRHQ